jgi:tRNA-Thr(GGU) m(6)t(6)A37 methyltransferase TsaA
MEVTMYKTSFTMNAIGYVESSVEDKVYEGWGKTSSRIHLDPEYIEGLQRLEEYSHLIVIYYMDQFQEAGEPGCWANKPRGREDMPEVGVFAQRTKYRPNPIGITAVQIISIEQNVITVKGLDANANTPVLDIKPYVPQFDRVDQATVPPWMETLMKGYF